MTVLMRIGVGPLLGFAVVSCGGGGAGADEGAIADVFWDFLMAFEDGDEEKLADCNFLFGS